MNVTQKEARTTPSGFGAQLSPGATLYIRGTSNGRRRQFIRIVNDAAVGNDLRIKCVARSDLPGGLVPSSTSPDVASRCFGQGVWDAHTDADLLLENGSGVPYNIYIFELFYYEAD